MLQLINFIDKDISYHGIITKVKIFLSFLGSPPTTCVLDRPEEESCQERRLQEARREEIEGSPFMWLLRLLTSTLTLQSQDLKNSKKCTRVWSGISWMPKFLMPWRRLIWIPDKWRLLTMETEKWLWPSKNDLYAFKSLTFLDNFELKNKEINYHFFISSPSINPYCWLTGSIVILASS